MRRGNDGFRALLVVSALVLARGSIARGAGSGEDSTADAWRQAAIENERLRRRVELAASKDFYLLLDPERSELRLMLEGVTLHTFSVSRLDLGMPERVFITHGSPTELRGRVWGPATVDPPKESERISIRIPDPNTPPEELEPPVPPPPSPVPARYFMRFSDDLTVEIRRSDLPEGAGSSILQGLIDGGRRKISDALAALGGAGPRLRLFLASNDAEALYRALPPGTKLLIL